MLLQKNSVLLQPLSNTSSQLNQQRDKRQKQQKLKAEMFSKLEQILKQLSNVQDIQFDSQNNIAIEDSVLEQLHKIEKQAVNNQLAEVKRLAVLAIGKRIFNIELKKKTEQFNQKQKKKEEIQDFFRENRIRKINYGELEDTKLQENTLIARPYATGKGFIQSTLYYPDYQNALQQCEYLSVIKKVNNLFFHNFTSSQAKTTQHAALGICNKIAYFFFSVTFGLGIVFPHYSFPYEEYVLMGLVFITMMMLSIASLISFLDKPNNNNQLQQTIHDVKQYFKQMNQKNLEEGKKFQWFCQDNFMYLQIKFQHQIPKD